MRKKILFPAVIAIAMCFSFINKKEAQWEKASKEELIRDYEKGMKWFSENLIYQVKIKHESFPDYLSVKPYEKSEGVYKRMNDNFFIYSLGTISIQNEKMGLLIDSASQLVVLKNKENLHAPFTPEKLKDMFKGIKNLKKQTSENGETSYRLEFDSNSPLSASEIKIDKKGLISGLKYYYSQEMQKDEEDENSVKGKPRMEISFTGYQTNVKFNYETDFSEKPYLREDKGKLLLKSNYKEFELKDYRFSVKK